MKHFLRHKNLILFVICLILLSACASNSNETTGDKETQEEYTAVELTSEEKDKFASLFTFLPNDVDNFSYNELDNQEKMHIAFNILKYQHTDKETHVIEEYEADKEAIEGIIKDYFGNDKTIEMEDYMCPYCEEGAIYSYNSNTGKFTEEIHGHGYVDVPVYYHIKNVSKAKDTYKIEVAKMYLELAGDDFLDITSVVYKTYDDSVNEENSIVDLEDTSYCSDYTCDYEGAALEYLDKLDTYTYTFKKENGTLKFIEYEIK